MTSATPHIKVQIVSNPVYLSGAREMVTNIASRLGFEELDCCKLALALDEALTNIIRHGYDNAHDRPIWISLWPVGDPAHPPCGIRIIIEDEAPCVDLEEIQGRDLEEIRPGGLGVHIIREIMDEVTYERRGERGMRLEMVKRAPGSAPTGVKAGGESSAAPGAVRYGSRRSH